MAAAHLLSDGLSTELRAKDRSKCPTVTVRHRQGPYLHIQINKYKCTQTYQNKKRTYVLVFVYVPALNVV